MIPTEFFVCDWYRNVNCENSENFYGLNEQIGKTMDSYSKNELMNSAREIIMFPNQTPNFNPGNDNLFNNYPADMGSSLGINSGTPSRGSLNLGQPTSAVDNYPFNPTAPSGVLPPQRGANGGTVYVNSLGQLSTDKDAGFDPKHSFILKPDKDSFDPIKGIGNSYSFGFPDGNDAPIRGSADLSEPVDLDSIYGKEPYLPPYLNDQNQKQLYTYPHDAQSQGPRNGQGILPEYTGQLNTQLAAQSPKYQAPQVYGSAQNRQQSQPAKTRYNQQPNVQTPGTPSQPQKFYQQPNGPSAQSQPQRSYQQPNNQKSGSQNQPQRLYQQPNAQTSGAQPQRLYQQPNTQSSGAQSQPQRLYQQPNTQSSRAQSQPQRLYQQPQSQPQNQYLQPAHNAQPFQQNNNYNSPSNNQHQNPSRQYLQPNNNHQQQPFSQQPQPFRAPQADRRQFNVQQNNQNGNRNGYQSQPSNGNRIGSGGNGKSNKDYIHDLLKDKTHVHHDKPQLVELIQRLFVPASSDNRVVSADVIPSHAKESYSFTYDGENAGSNSNSNYQPANSGYHQQHTGTHQGYIY